MGGTVPGADLGGIHLDWLLGWSPVFKRKVDVKKSTQKLWRGNGRRHKGFLRNANLEFRD